MNRKKILEELRRKDLIFNEDYNILLKEIELQQEKVLSNIKKEISGKLFSRK